ncbi:DUF1588 domain-containing protein, partial [Endomicrobium sp. AH-315-J14]|nr:DUF1588 domain-containing protein [Endomicrobium sp. AH-315-J14]
LTANYIMVTPLSARSYGVEATFVDDANPLEFAEAQIPDIPHAGFLTSPMFLSRHSTTDTNRNRHRALVTIRAWLGTDLLKTAEQAVDQSLVTDFNPTRNNPACTVCHAVHDPMSGAFMAWDENGAFNPDPDWYEEMWEPGWGNSKLPESEWSNGLQWLAQEMVRDEGFALGAVYMMYEGLTGRERLVAPNNFADPLYSYEFEAFMAQADELSRIAGEFRTADYNLKVIVKELVLGPYFRAINAEGLSDDELTRVGEVGMAHMLTPEQLHRKIVAVLGMPWTDNDSARPHLNFRPRDPARAGEFQLFYGGHDSNSTTKRITEPTGLLSAVADRMAIEMSCQVVPRDFFKDQDERVLFQWAEIDGVSYDLLGMEPLTPAGLPIAQHISAIKENIVRLHGRLLGEKLTLDDEEVEFTYQLFLKAWKDGNDQMNAGNVDGMDGQEPLSTQLPSPCRVTEDFWTGKDYPEELRLIDDEKFVVRAWMAVTTYLLSDYRFLYE